MVVTKWPVDALGNDTMRTRVQSCCEERKRTDTNEAMVFGALSPGTALILIAAYLIGRQQLIANAVERARFANGRLRIR